MPREVNIEGRTPVATTKTDEDGKFSLDLPPGKYTIVAVVNGAPIHADGAGPKNGNTWSTISVKSGQEIEQTIRDNQVTH